MHVRAYMCVRACGVDESTAKDSEAKTAAQTAKLDNQLRKALTRIAELEARVMEQGAELAQLRPDPDPQGNTVGQVHVWVCVCMCMCVCVRACVCVCEPTLILFNPHHRESMPSP